MYDALDVSRYVINYSNSKLNGISNLKLQKILYFIQVYFLIKTKKPCFLDKIEAWNFGPVIPRVYNEFKQYGASNIHQITRYVEYSKDNIWTAKYRLFNPNIILKKDKEYIEFIINMFSNYSATELTELTHNQAPWKDAYLKDKEITISKLIEYFNLTGKKSPSSIGGE